MKVDRDSMGEGNPFEGGNGRSLASILTEMKDELQEFVQTRIELFRKEIKEKVKSIKAAAPLVGVGVLFLATGFLVLTFGIVAVIAAAFGATSYGWFFAGLIVWFVWTIAGAIAISAAKKAIGKEAMVPRKTIHVLSRDKEWLRDEARHVL